MVDLPRELSKIKSFSSPRMLVSLFSILMLCQGPIPYAFLFLIYVLELRFIIFLVF